MAELRIACVSAPTSNAFIFEILEAVADEVRALGVDSFVHRGTVADVDDGHTAFLIIPHEYYWFSPRPSAEHLRRTITLDVEHPGTNGFAVTSRVAEVVGAVFEISSDSVAELSRRGLRADLFTIGYSARWDMWGGLDTPRTVDLTYMAAADRERLQALAALAPDLADIDANLLIPPYESRVKPRPDFLMGADKWRFLAGANLLLNLHRESKTALEMIRVVEAMCNGCVVLTEPSTALGMIEPDTHILVAPRASIGRTARTLLEQPDRVEQVRHAAYAFCKQQLSMRPSAERLIAVAEEVVRRANEAGAARAVHMPDWPEHRPAHVPDVADWLPEPYSLPSTGVTQAGPVRESIAQLVAHRREHMELHDIRVGDASGEIDVLVVAHAGSGPLARTLASLRAQELAVNIHVAGLGIPAPAYPGAVSSYLTCSRETSIGAARNELLDRSSAPYVFVLEAGDEVFAGTLRALADELASAPEVDVAYTMAAYGEQTLVNLFFPETHRLERFAYLTRGYLARRETLNRLGRFAEDPTIELYADHAMWRRVVADPDANVRHLHRIGLRLAPTDLSKVMPFDVAEAHTLLSRAPAPNAGPAARDADLPTVTAIMGAYNYGRFIVEAIDSAMQQDYPAELLDLVVVDDGSSDDTAELVQACADRYPGRITLIRQANAGATAATNRARREATGDLIALLDADDVWLPDKTRRQVELLQRRPELGMVFSQMRLIDADGRTLRDGYGHREPMDVNQFARVLWENVAVQSSLLIEGDLFDEIPADAPYADWWLCLRAAQFKQIDYIAEDLVLYRWHGANITGGVGGAKALREAQKGIAFQRWVLRTFELGEFTSRLAPAELRYVLTGLENQAQKGLLGLGSHFAQLADVNAGDREAAAADLEAAVRAEAEGEITTACALMLRACTRDPYDGEVRAAFDALVTRAESGQRLPDPLAGSREFLVLADASFVLDDDDHLRAYASAMRGVRSATLAIDASALEPAAAAVAIRDQVQRCGLDEDEDVSMLAIVGALDTARRTRVHRASKAIYGPRTQAGPLLDIPTFSAASLARLRAMAEAKHTQTLRGQPMNSEQSSTMTIEPPGRPPAPGSRRAGGVDAHLRWLGERRRTFSRLHDFTTGRGLEIGALDCAAVDPATADVSYVDVYDRAGIQDKYRDDDNVLLELIPETTFPLWDGERIRSLEEAAAGGAPYDWVLASHVVEHIPNLVEWLASIARLTSPTGVLVLAAPDRRFTFDCHRPPTTVGQVVEAYLRGDTRPSPRAVYDSLSKFVRVDGGILRDGVRPPGRDARRSDAAEALRRTRSTFETDAYLDTHVWTFSAPEFVELITELREAGLSDWYVERLAGDQPAPDFEFYVVLRKVPQDGGPFTEVRSDAELPAWLAEQWKLRDTAQQLSRQLAHTVSMLQKIAEVLQQKPGG